LPEYIELLKVFVLQKSHLTR